MSRRESVRQSCITTWLITMCSISVGLSLGYLTACISHWERRFGQTPAASRIGKRLSGSTPGPVEQRQYRLMKLPLTDVTTLAPRLIRPHL
jgi:hypothetical protein